MLAGMTLHPWVAAVLLVGASVSTTACSSDKSTSDSTKTPASTPDAGPKDSGSVAKTPHVDAYNQDCSTARWANVSDGCWSCLCTQCADSLNKCNGRCAAGMACAFEKKTFVNVAADLSCELAVTVGDCLKEEGGIAQAAAIAAFDGCLVAKADQSAGEFRTCEKECGLTYPGDVCARANATP
jgi:hypothetical protein